MNGPKAEMNCPACFQHDSYIFHTVARAPVHSVLLLDSRAEAVGFEQRPIKLAFCRGCGFIWNAVFEPAVHQYGDRYEPTQAYSPTFNKFHAQLVDDLIERFDLRGKRVVEIGCGQGEFLQLLCERGDNSGVGFDPAYSAERGVTPSDNIRFVQDFYSQEYGGESADFYVCKMTLEHVRDVHNFVSTVRNAVGEHPNAIVFFQVPAIERILNEAAFWDIYYEHCSYFSRAALAGLFRRCRFDVIDLWRDYGDQYLMLAARPAATVTDAALPFEHELQAVADSVADAARRIPPTISAWQQHIARDAARGESIVLWGGGSKGVAFLTTVGIDDDTIRYVVDINPHKAHTFMAGSGQEIVTPDSLKGYRPNRVIVMNPVYVPEISATLHSLGLSPHVEAVDMLPQP